MTSAGMWIWGRSLRALPRIRRAGWVGALLIAGSLAASTGSRAAEPLPRTLHPLNRQTSDQAILGDIAAIDGWRAKLDALPGASQDPWRAAAARAWLTAARAEYQDNDENGFPQASFERAVALVTEIESGQTPHTYQTVPAAVRPPGVPAGADSLYGLLEVLKREEQFLCAAEELANMEMQLAWAVNEGIDQGDCWSSPHLVNARDLAQSARLKIEACVPAPVVQREVPAPVVPKPDTVFVPGVTVPTVEELKISRNVHFALAKADIGPLSSQVIRGIADLLIKYPSITVRMEGHTDSRGNVMYNLDLSRRRVMAARSVFLALGVDSSRITFTYKGKSELFAPEESKKGFALNRRVEMVFVDPEGRDIKTEHQEGDIQLEADRVAKPPVVRKTVARPSVRTTRKPAAASRDSTR